MTDIKDGSDLQDTRINPPAADATGGKEHVDAALDKADKGLDPNHVQANLLAGKFKSRDELLKGISHAAGAVYKDDGALVELYKTLEKRIGGQKADETPPAGAAPADTGTPNDPSKGTAATPPKKEGENTDTPKVDDAARDKEFFNKFAEEFVQSGQLSEDSYKSLNEAGFGKDMVDTYLNGIRYNLGQIYNRVGGQDKYTAMLSWAASNISEAEQAAFDKAIGGPEPGRNLAIDGLWQRFTKANGSPSSRMIVPGSNIGGGVRGFASQAELKQAMADPRYGKDPAYEQEILAKLSISKI